VTDPALGEIRLRWWLDALGEIEGRAGEGPNPALRALSVTVARHALPLAPVVALVEARSADFYADPPAAQSDVEGRLGETQSALFQLGCIVAGAAAATTADAAGHAGVAYGMARRLAAFAGDRARGRTMLPADLLATEDLQAIDVFAAEPSSGLVRTVLALTSFARHHLRLARGALARTPREALPVFLPLATVEPLLDRIERLGPEITTRPATLSDFRMLWLIGAARLRGFSNPNEAG
jgi:phytoene synthase